MDLWQMITSRANNSHQIETAVSLVLTQMAMQAPNPREYVMVLAREIERFILITLEENSVGPLPH